MTGIDEQAYASYFGHEYEPDDDQPELREDYDKLVFEQRSDNRIHDTEIVVGRELNNLTLKLMADNNIDDLGQLADILKRLCNAAWGPDWGELSLDIPKGDDSTSITMPRIVVSMNYREIDEDLGGLKPILTDAVDEVDDEGNKTGDVFLVYRQWFSCNVEFDIYGRNSQEMRDLKNRFEKLLSIYTGYLKREGISEIFFLSEASPQCSLNYDEKASMSCIYYYIRFETISPIRQNTINNINAAIGLNSLDTDNVKTALHQNKIVASPDFDFFEGDSGITVL